jgi:hypothetical protein
LANPSPLLIECCRWVGNPKLLGKPRCTNYWDITFWGDT